MTIALVARWIAQPRVGVFITSTPKTRAELRQTTTPLSNDGHLPIAHGPQTTSSSDTNMLLHVARHVARLKSVWDKRFAHENESWNES